MAKYTPAMRQRSACTITITMPDHTRLTSDESLKKFNQQTSNTATPLYNLLLVRWASERWPTAGYRDRLSRKVEMESATTTGRSAGARPRRVFTASRVAAPRARANSVASEESVLSSWSKEETHKIIGQRVGYRRAACGEGRFRLAVPRCLHPATRSLPSPRQPQW